MDAPTEADAPATEAADGSAFWDAVSTADLDALGDVLALDAEEHPALRTVLPWLAAYRRSADWWYRTGWEGLADVADPELRGRWLVVTDPERAADDGLVRWAADALRRAGAEVTVVDSPYELPGGDGEEDRVAGCCRC
ncbi:hypothetical protein NKH77_47580 [Streptomyces sp. M19]